MTESTMDTRTAGPSVPATSDEAGVQAPVPAALPDDRNPAIRDAHRTFIITLIGAALFVGSVFVFIL